MHNLSGKQCVNSLSPFNCRRASRPIIQRRSAVDSLPISIITNKGNNLARKSFYAVRGEIFIIEKYIDFIRPQPNIVLQELVNLVLWSSNRGDY